MDAKKVLEQKLKATPSFGKQVTKVLPLETPKLREFREFQNGEKTKRTAIVEQEVEIKGKFEYNPNSGVATMRDYDKESGFEDKRTRVAFLPVGANTTEKEVNDFLIEWDIVEKKSYLPIIGPVERFQIDSGLTTVAEIAEGQVVRYPDSHELAGTITIHNGRPYYRKTQLAEKGSHDIDLRPNEADVAYWPKSLETEVETAIKMTNSAQNSQEEPSLG